MSDAAAAAAPAPKSGPSMVVVILAALVAAGAAGAGVYFMTAKKDKGEEAAHAEEAKAPTKTPALYAKLDPPFVANFEAKGMMRFLQVSVEVMTRDAAMLDTLKAHEPMIRNDLLMLFGSQKYEAISSSEGKERLRAEALETVRKIVTAEGGEGAKVEQLYFTSFVMQ
jgi:flagellar FliL protein